MMGCESKGNDQKSFAWQIFILKTEMKTSLVTERTVTHYDGSSEVVTYKNEPSSNKVYLLLELKIDKTLSNGTAFTWDKLSLIDEDGNVYQRIKDDFLGQHNYDRLASINLRLSGNQGWICFEISETSDKKKLNLVYQADEGDNSIPVSK